MITRKPAIKSKTWPLFFSNRDYFVKDRGLFFMAFYPARGCCRARARGGLRVACADGQHF